MKINNLIGARYGLLTVIRCTEKKSKDGCVVWECKCDCGNTIELATNALKRPERKSCGCLVNKREDLTGKKYGRLTVIKYIEFDTKQNSCKYLCKCDCGNEKIIASTNLKKRIYKILWLSFNRNET